MDKYQIRQEIENKIKTEYRNQEQPFLPKDYKLPETKPYEDWKDRYCDKVEDQQYRWGVPKGAEF